MQEHKLYKTGLAMASLAVFRGVLHDPVVNAFCGMLETAEAPLPERLKGYSEFAALLLAQETDWSRYLLLQVLSDENRYIRLLAAGKDPGRLAQETDRELAILQAAAQLTPEAAAQGMGCTFPLATWETSPLDFAASCREHIKNLPRQGYGIYARHHMFLLEDSELLPVRSPDPVLPEELCGYEAQRTAVMRNTIALVEGRPAANALLYGDSGTGKSTCVKAVANALRDRGLRLVELRKDQLGQIPRLLDRLCTVPLKFILFIDDLSFPRESDSYAALKAVLEGSVAARTPNILIYATSNRRHLIREAFSDRDSDEVHLRDTMEELSSLSDRFGLLVTFLRPDRDAYLQTAAHYCRRFGVELNAQQAEAFALRRGGRSPRVARQYAEALAAAHP